MMAFGRSFSGMLIVWMCLAFIGKSYAFVLMKSPSWTSDICSWMSVLFDDTDTEEETLSKLKFDYQSDTWVKTCPEINCPHGMDDKDEDICPSCLLGPGESCSSWGEKCGEMMICRYSSAFSCTGKCVFETEFKSRKKGEACGVWEGQCGSGLKCRFEPSSWIQLCGMEESGTCVTEEDFLSRGEGESCSETAGHCREGLTCIQHDFFWTSSVCENLKTKDLPSSQALSDNIFFFNNLCDDQFSLNGNENHDRKLVAEVISGNDEEILQKESEVVEEILVHEFSTSQDATVLKEEETILEGMIDTALHQSSITSANYSSNALVEVVELPEGGMEVIVSNLLEDEVGEEVETTEEATANSETALITADVSLEDNSKAILLYAENSSPATATKAQASAVSSFSQAAAEQT